MNNNFKELIDRFKEINNKGYVKGINNNLINACGLTFESLLDKKPDSMFFPDFKDIEIKSTQRFSRYPCLYENNYILQTYGKRDSLYSSKKTLITNLKFREKIKVGDYYFELDIDENRKRIFVNIYNPRKILIEKRCFISFK